MRDTGDVTLGVDHYEFMTDESKTCVGLRLTLKDGYSATLRTVTIPIDPGAAFDMGAMLIAHSDWLLGKPLRDWSQLDA